MKILLGIFFSCSFLFVSAQNLEFSEKYSAYIDQADLKRNLTIFASDSFLGRETGKEGQRLAADFLCNYFKKLGCDFLHIIRCLMIIFVNTTEIKNSRNIVFRKIIVI